MTAKNIRGVYSTPTIEKEYNMRKKSKKLRIAAFLAALLILFQALTPAVFAAGESTKEEVVYGVLDGGGGAQDVYVVNKFTSAYGATTTDFGNYSQVLNMSDNQPIENKAGAVDFSAPQGQFYYEGTLENAELPWLITLNYSLNGKTLSPQELAGQSGALRLEITTAKNPKADPAFFEKYALQVTLTLDTALCQNIHADGATTANVGNNQQLTYTLLPGSQKTIVLTADVVDFEMAPITINGLRLALNVDFDDEALKNEATTLMDGVAAVDTGAQALTGETAALSQGAADLQAGIATMKSGLTTLNDQSAALTQGSAGMTKALAELETALGALTIAAADLGTLVTATGEIKAALDELSTGTQSLQSSLSYDAYRSAMSAGGFDVDTLAGTNAATADNLNEQIQRLTALRDATTDEALKLQLTEVLEGLQPASEVMSANNALLAAQESYFDGLSAGAAPLAEGAAALNDQFTAYEAALNELTTTLASLPPMLAQLEEAVHLISSEYQKLDTGISQYTTGVATLLTGFSQLENGVSALTEGSQSLQQGSAELAAGTGTLHTETSGLDRKIDDEVAGVLDKVSGDDTPPISFASPQNGQVKSVQFALRTEAIEITEEKETPSPTPETSSVWDKLMDLFN